MGLSFFGWLSVGLILMGLEIIVPGFVLFWFGLGAVISACSVLIFQGLHPEAQWLIFLTASLAFLSVWHLLLKKRFWKNEADDTRDPTLTGLRGRVIERIMPGIPGRVELYDSFHGIKVWQSESETDIAVGEEVIVREARGIKLIVEKNL